MLGEGRYLAGSLWAAVLMPLGHWAVGDFEVAGWPWACARWSGAGRQRRWWSAQSVETLEGLHLRFQGLVMWTFELELHRHRYRARALGCWGELWAQS